MALAVKEELTALPDRIIDQNLKVILAQNSSLYGRVKGRGKNCFNSNF